MADQVPANCLIGAYAAARCHSCCGRLSPKSRQPAAIRASIVSSSAYLVTATSVTFRADLPLRVAAASGYTGRRDNGAGFRRLGVHQHTCVYAPSGMHGTARDELVRLLLDLHQRLDLAAGVESCDEKLRDKILAEQRCGCRVRPSDR